MKFWLGGGLVMALTAAALGADLTVGAGRQFARIEDAAARAKAGDVILVYPGSYEKVAVFVRQRGLAFKAVSPDAAYIKLSGQGFDYSGAGSVPRAIFQFNKGTDGCTIEGFELCDARNESHNGAGIRINQANDVTVRRCDIHDNDMGIMSNGDGTANTAVNQRIEACRIHANGSTKEPGFNHNLYLGGASVTLSACEVFASVTGHNVKSRAHQTRVEYCYIHDSNNREFDLVDGKGDTDAPDSDAILVGNIIVKDPQCPGNHETIHFGQDGGKEHDGTIYLVNNTIVTPFASPVVTLSAPKARASFLNNIIWGGQVLVAAAKHATLEGTTASHDWVSSGFGHSLKMLGAGAVEAVYVAGPREAPPFADAARGDYRLTALLGPGLAWKSITLPTLVGAADGPGFWEYVQPASKKERTDGAGPSLGAFEAAK